MKLASWNVNGIRACFKKGLAEWLTHSMADIICLQEIKAEREIAENLLQNRPNYQQYFAVADKKGYSGVAVLIHQKLGLPLWFQAGLGIPEFDREGRTLFFEFKDFFFVGAYFPNGQRDHSRVDFKLQYSYDLKNFCQKLRQQSKKEIIICGDFNTAHHPIDLKNPKGNLNTTGFLPRERAFLDELIKDGYVDVFRHQHPGEEGHYTWWTYRNDCRQRNIGWRIDYFFVTAGLLPRIRNSTIACDIHGSDHCPILMELQ